MQIKPRNNVVLESWQKSEIYRIAGIYEKIDQYIKLNKMYAAGKMILEYLSMAWVSILMLT